MEEARFSLRIPSKLLEKLDKMAEEKSISRNELILRALADWTEKQGHERYFHFNFNGKSITIVDNLLNQVIDLRTEGKRLYCPIDNSTKCGHTRFAYTLKEVKEAVRKEIIKPFED